MTRRIPEQTTAAPRSRPHNSPRTACTQAMSRRLGALSSMHRTSGESRGTDGPSDPAGPSGSSTELVDQCPVGASGEVGTFKYLEPLQWVLEKLEVVIALSRVLDIENSVRLDELDCVFDVWDTTGE